MRQEHRKMNWRLVRRRTSTVAQWTRRQSQTELRYRWWGPEYGEFARAERHEDAQVPGAEQEEQAVAVREGAAQVCAER
jgi:hypothetical protein